MIGKPGRHAHRQTLIMNRLGVAATLHDDDFGARGVAQESKRNLKGRDMFFSGNGEDEARSKITSRRQSFGPPLHAGRIVGDAAAIQAGGEARKEVFFFEKKKQKTSIRLVHNLSCETSQLNQLIKFFCFFLFTKRRFFSLPEPRSGCLRQ